MATRTFKVQEGRTPKYPGPCAKCGGGVDPKRSWEAVLLYASPRAGKPALYKLAHAGCIGGSYGGVQGKWRGPDSVTLTVD